MVRPNGPSQVSLGLQPTVSDHPKHQSPGRQRREGFSAVKRLAERNCRMRFSPGRDGGPLPSAIADGNNDRCPKSPGRDDSERGQIGCRPFGTLGSTRETSPATVVTGIELPSLPGLNRRCQTHLDRSGIHRGKSFTALPDRASAIETDMIRFLCSWCGRKRRSAAMKRLH